MRDGVRQTIIINENCSGIRCEDEGLEDGKKLILREKLLKVMTSFVKTEEEESDDLRFSLELPDEEQMEQPPLGSSAKIISSTTLETLPAGEAVTDSELFLRTTNRYTPEEHELLKQLHRKHYIQRTKRMNGQDQLRVARRFAPGELVETQRKRIRNFFLTDPNEIPALTKQTSSRRFLFHDSLFQLPSGRQLGSTRRSKSKIIQQERLADYVEDVEDVEEQKISRSELEEIFLERANALVSEDRINQIFRQADIEGTGLVHADDVADYISSIEPRTPKERQNHIYRSILTSRSFWCAISFVVGAIANIITNLRQREYGDLHGDESHYYFQVGAWAFQIGCLGFLFLDYDFEKIAYESLQLMDQKLVRWIRRGAYPVEHS
jgi:hypothetical protein